MSDVPRHRGEWRQFSLLLGPRTEMFSLLLLVHLQVDVVGTSYCSCWSAELSLRRIMSLHRFLLISVSMCLSLSLSVCFDWWSGGVYTWHNATRLGQVFLSCCCVQLVAPHCGRNEYFLQITWFIRSFWGPRLYRINYKLQSTRWYESSACLVHCLSRLTQRASCNLQLAPWSIRFRFTQLASFRDTAELQVAMLQVT